MAAFFTTSAAWMALIKTKNFILAARSSELKGDGFDCTRLGLQFVR